MGECKTHLEIAKALAKKLGVTDFENETDTDLLRREVAASEIPDYDFFRRKGVYRIPTEKSYVAFREQIEDPENCPFLTPSGKIEIFSREWADLQDPKVPPIPKYMETWEGRNDPLFETYPLQLITSHCRRRTHGQFDTIPWLRELEEQAIYIHHDDAKDRCVLDGEKVRVFNDRGELIITARVTERIMPGVVDIPQGAWYKPDKNSVDMGGNPNVLTRDEISPHGALTYNTCLVQVEKI